MTVLFADLSGYTAVAERMDPEAVKSLVDRALRRLGEEVERFGGTVDKYIGDNVMALFGAPVAHEDDAERAVRAALGMQEAMEEINALGCRWTSTFALRVGINTGEVLAGAVGDDYTVTGDTVNVASRLQSAGRPGAVTVGERTVRATQRRGRLRASSSRSTLKGKAEPVPAWEAVGLVARPAGAAASRWEESPLVGRDDELACSSPCSPRSSASGRAAHGHGHRRGRRGQVAPAARVRAAPGRRARTPAAAHGPLPALRLGHRLLGAGRGHARGGRRSSTPTAPTRPGRKLCALRRATCWTDDEDARAPARRRSRARSASRCRPSTRRADAGGPGAHARGVLLGAARR